MTGIAGVDPTKEAGNDAVRSTTIHVALDEGKLHNAKFSSYAK